MNIFFISLSLALEGFVTIFYRISLSTSIEGGVA